MSAMASWESQSNPHHRPSQLAGLLILAAAFSVSPCSKLAASDSDTCLENLYASAQAAQARGDYRAAAASYQEILKLRPELAEAWANLGLMHQFLGEYQIADQHFQTALRKNPQFLSPIFSWASIFCDNTSRKPQSQTWSGPNGLIRGTHKRLWALRALMKVQAISSRPMAHSTGQRRLIRAIPTHGMGLA